jgi:Spy/CpxP family protein refolding chaperone
MRTILVAAVAISAMPALAADSPAPARPAEPDPDRIVCKSVAVTGSRVSGERQCMTARQWDALREQGQRFLRSQQQRAVNATKGS